MNQRIAVPPAAKKKHALSLAGGLTTLLLIGMLVCHVWLAGVCGWRNGNMPGNEFRQTQTALSAYFIQQEHNFSLAYPTPVLGKPWSVPMEFPLYEWTVVLVANETNLSITHSARLVSLVCFYLMLPGLFFVLRHFDFKIWQRGVVVALAFSCPVLIFYTRACLIETMALLFSVWFLAAFGEMTARRSVAWLVVASILGVLAGVEKVTTFMVALIPAGAWTLWLIVRDLRDPEAGWPAAAKRAALGAGVLVLPVIVTTWWTHFADAIKSRNPGAAFLESKNMVGFNFGLWSDRISGANWRAYWDHLSTAMLSPWTLGLAVIILAVWGGRWRLRAVLLVGSYLASLMVFPRLFSFHDYYAVAHALFLVTVAGMAVAALAETRAKWRWLAGPVLIVMLLTDLQAYHRTYFQAQTAATPGGSPMSRVIRRITNPDDVMVVAGDDWGAIIPFYSRRRALMIRAGMENNGPFVHQCFKNLQGEAVTLYLAKGVQEQNLDLLYLTQQYFQIDPRPLFHWHDFAAYVRRDRWEAAAARLQNLRAGTEIHPTAAALAVHFTLVNRVLPTSCLLGDQRDVLKVFSPAPVRFFSQFGLHQTDEAGRHAVIVHPHTKLWFELGPGGHRLVMTIGMAAAAYAPSLREADATDGVAFTALAEAPDGSARKLHVWTLRPRQVPADRGFHEVGLDFNLKPGETLRIETDPAGSFTRDWALLTDLKLTPSANP